MRKLPHLSELPGVYFCNKLYLGTKHCFKLSYFLRYIPWCSPGYKSGPKETYYTIKNVTKMRSNLKGIDSNFALVSNSQGLKLSGKYCRRITILIDWAIKWQMKFRIKKMQSSTHGKNNLNHTYTMIGSKLAITTQERDLEGFVDSFLKTLYACLEGNGILGMIRKGNE